MSEPIITYAGSDDAELRADILQQMMAARGNVNEPLVRHATEFLVTEKAMDFLT